ncbi:MAG TPA: hypothetical protein VD866_14335, partial [Urbifossiella sp.]|nr:hypothetical protein [Urbifossiella sp.]
MNADDVNEEADRARDRCDYATALALYRQAGDLYAAGGDEPARVRCLAWAGAVRYETGDLAAGLDALGEAAGAARACRDPHALYVAALRFGLALYDQGRLAEALGELRSAEPELPALGSFELRSDLHHSLGLVLMGAGRLEEALEELTKAMIAAVSVEYAVGEAEACGSMSHVWLLLGRPDQAEKVARGAVEAAERSGNPRQQGDAALTLANALRMGADYEEAYAIFSGLVAEPFPDAATNSHLFQLTADTCRAMGRVDEAEELLDRAEAAADALPDPYARCNVRVTRAWLAHDRQDWAACLDQARDAMHLFLGAVAANIRPHAVSHLLVNYRTVFELGVTAARRLGDASSLTAGIAFMDAAKCAAV